MKARVAASGCVVLSLVGLALCGVLVYVHLGLLRGELLGGLVCGEGGAFNCHAVVGSAYGAAFGVPLAVWGLIGYVTTFALAMLAAIEERGSWSVERGASYESRSTSHAQGALTLLAGVALFMVGVDLYLLWVMAGVIGALCPLCLATYGVNLGLLVVAGCFAAPSAADRGSWIVDRGRALRVLVPGRERPAAWAFWGMLGLGVAGSLGLHAAVTFVSQGTPASVRERVRQFVGQQTPQRIETAQDPALGPADAPFEVVEFSDFLCPICRKAARMNAVLLAGHRRDVRFVFKHFPLDTVCNQAISKMLHPGACQAAVVAECAHQQGKFWPFHDLIFEKGKGYRVDSLEEDARRLGLDADRFRGCIASGAGLQAVQRDIAEAARIGLQSTPVYFINGIRIDGVITPAVFEAVLEALGHGE